MEFVDEPHKKAESKRRNFSLQKADTVNLDEGKKAGILKVDARIMTPVNDQTDNQIIDSPSRRPSKKQPPVAFIESPNETQNISRFDSSVKRNDSQLKTQAKSNTNLGGSSLSDEEETAKEVAQEDIDKM